MSKETVQSTQRYVRVLPRSAKSRKPSEEPHPGNGEAGNGEASLSEGRSGNGSPAKKNGAPGEPREEATVRHELATSNGHREPLSWSARR